jgi:hypothetical protein
MILEILTLAMSIVAACIPGRLGTLSLFVGLAYAATIYVAMYGDFLNPRAAVTGELAPGTLAITITVLVSLSLLVILRCWHPPLYRSSMLAITAARGLRI